MRNITELECCIKYKPREIQHKKELLIKEKNIISCQLSLMQTPDNYKYLNNVMLALKSAEKIIETLTFRFKN
ncbi:EscE/YscE/SsaE family type III secretion system needle protein co-chaperone [Yersinia aleksiciae]|uniref:EscE/YscE/SsaE family type III secretion system needle protein co-chaperone n=1 Tax=Yersinia aleksiciae TaxID=263819 RepID=UPI00119D4B1C|nr:EscE/YscE/SsaE family type III secretion system needle protein co-chaperone [Yersinia aleksiciae]